MKKILALALAFTLARVLAEETTITTYGGSPNRSVVYVPGVSSLDVFVASMVVTPSSDVESGRFGGVVVFTGGTPDWVNYINSIYFKFPNGSVLGSVYNAHKLSNNSVSFYTDVAVAPLSKVFTSGSNLLCLYLYVETTNDWPEGSNLSFSNTGWGLSYSGGTTGLSVGFATNTVEITKIPHMYVNVDETNVFLSAVVPIRYGSPYWLYQYSDGWAKVSLNDPSSSANVIAGAVIFGRWQCVLQKSLSVKSRAFLLEPIDGWGLSPPLIMRGGLKEPVRPAIKFY